MAFLHPLYTRGLSLLFIVAISIIREANVVRAWENVARSSNGATCTATNSDGSDCAQALDGVLHLHSQWMAAQNQAVGSWIQIIFRETFTLTYARLMQRFGSHEQISQVLLDFANGPTIAMGLTERTGEWNDFAAQFYDVMALDNIHTSGVVITITAVYTDTLDGFVETEFYTGINPCPERYTLQHTGCYRPDFSSLVTWSDARAQCSADGTDLAGLEYRFEFEVVTNWMPSVYNLDDNHVWLRGVEQGGIWHWADPADTWFNWAPGGPNAGDSRATLRTSSWDMGSASPDAPGYLICEICKWG